MFGAAYRKCRAGEMSGVLVERAGAATDMRPAVADAERVVVASGQRRLQADAGVEAGVDQVAIGRRAHSAGEDTNRLRPVRLAPHHLVDDAVNAEIAVVSMSEAVACRTRQRHAVGIETLIEEAAAVVPAAKLVGAWQATGETVAILGR